MCKRAIVKERKKNAKKLTIKCLKWSKISWNTPKFILNPNYKVKSSNWQSIATKGSSLSRQNRNDFFCFNWQGTKLIINYFQLFTYIIPKRLNIKTSSFQEKKAQSLFCFAFKGHISYHKRLEITRRSVKAMKRNFFAHSKKNVPKHFISG